MNRILTLLAAAAIVLTAVAQQSLATLSHNGELSFFDSNNCFVEALNKAVNGDTIYLSAGNFLSLSTITINKKLCIIGCGYESHIMGDVTINMDSNPNSNMNAPLFDGVRIGTLRFYNSENSRKNLGKVEIRKCRIGKLENGGCAGTSFLVDRCWIDDAYFDGAEVNFPTIRNSKIKEIGPYGGAYISVINCNISGAKYCPRAVVSSIIEKGTWNADNKFMSTSGTHNIENTLLSSGMNFHNSQNVKKENCYFEDNKDKPLLDENLECTINLEEKGYVGTDGTVIGIHGGYYPFSEYPSVPTVDSTKSSVKYDAESNKLNVTISVHPID